ncbi:DUF2079 domain-containing protein [Streptomyces sp. CC77]|uniref:DUF2079 domain-containing protein n=1 Tax=Streptomyces sp. CC77 TaxID=1906739 RepID=UPI0020C8E9A3|nr:DUF2079 domain-containing protein [Streptomyces sp. CC77]
MLTALCFLVCCGIGLQSWTALRVAGFDLGIFDQAVRSYADFALPRSAIKNVHHEFPPGFSVLGDHFSPVLALLAPLYWVWDDPRTLIVAQAALFAAGVPVVRRIARHCFAGAAPAAVRRAADTAGLVYALGWPLANAAYSGFHEVAFAVPVTLLMLERGLARRHGTAALWAAVLCTVKEDMGLVVGLFGALLAVRAHRAGSRGGRTTGLVLMVAGPAVTAVAVRWFLPAMGGVPGYYWSYGRVGADPGEALVRLVTEPWAVALVAVTPTVKVALLAWLLGTLALLPLGSPTFLPALPLLAERVLSDNPNHWPAIHHYDAFLWPILLTAALETAGRVHRARSRLPHPSGREHASGAGQHPGLGRPPGPELPSGRERPPRPGRLRGTGWPAGHPAAAALPGAAVALSTAATLFLGAGVLLNPQSWRPDPEARALVQAAELIPDGATVEADNNIAPRLTSRTDVVIADATPRGADWVLMREGRRSFPFLSAADQRRRIALLRDHGYTETWSRDGVVLLHRTRAETVPGTRRPGPGSVPVRERVPADVGRDLFRR